MYFPVKNSGIIRRTVGHVQAVDGISFQVPEGGSLGLVGESGCGKSTTGRLITRLYKPTEGEIDFDGKDIAKLLGPAADAAAARDPDDLPGPGHVAEPAAHRRHHRRRAADDPQRGAQNKVMGRVKELLEVVGLNPEHYNRYPHEFSGGQRQRIGIARALTLQPKLLVADEPVSALDVSIQAQVINLLQDLQNEFKISFLFIAHDLAVVRHFCPEVAVMYLGKIVEVADRDTIYPRRTTPTRRPCCPRSPTCGRRRSAVAGSGSACRATSPARSTRRPVAGSAPAARSRRTSAPGSSRR